MKELTVDLGQRAYPIHVGEGALELLGEELKRLKATRVLLVTNSTVGPLYERAALQSICRAQTDLPVAVVTLPDGECFKGFAPHRKDSLGSCGRRARPQELHRGSWRRRDR